MADVRVKRGTVVDGRVTALVVGFDGLADRTIDRATALGWLADGHSFVPVIDGARGPALQRVEVADDRFVIRTDNAPVDEDALPGLPPA